MNEWIPVDERLPDDSRIVLMCAARGGIYLGRYKSYYWEKAFYKGSAECNPVAWMELPEPYTPKKGLK